MDLHRIDNTDQNCRDLVQSALERNCHFAGRHVRVELFDGEVVLKGIVRSYYQKQLAQESVRSVGGIRQVRNEIEVVSV